MNLSDRIKFRMTELNLTQEAVANRAGISQGMVYKLLSKKTKSTSKLIELAEALECSIEWLARGQTEIREQSEAYHTQTSLSAEQVKAHLAKLPAEIQKTIALDTLASLIDRKR